MLCAFEGPAALLSDAPLLLALVLGYVLTHFIFKASARARSHRSLRLKAKGNEAPLKKEHATEVFAALPVEVQARIAGMTGIAGWAAWGECSQDANYIFSDDRIWAYSAGDSQNKVRRTSSGLDKLSELRLRTEADVEAAVRMLRAALPSDNVAELFLGLFRSAEGAASLYWTGQGSMLGLGELGTQCVERCDLFTPEQRREIAKLVAEHEELAELCQVPEVPSVDEDFAKELLDHLENQLLVAK